MSILLYHQCELQSNCPETYQNNVSVVAHHQITVPHQMDYFQLQLYSAENLIFELFCPSNVNLNHPMTAEFEDLLELRREMRSSKVHHKIIRCTINTTLYCLLIVSFGHCIVNKNFLQ